MTNDEIQELRDKILNPITILMLKKSRRQRRCKTAHKNYRFYKPVRT